MTSRAEALRMPHSEPTINGRCVGRLEYDDRHGTVLLIEYCECPGGRHVTPGRENER